ncbi:MAG: NTP transferase domain-containing protein [Chitinophagaceae bacterium]|nr:NTP transferase domain-containing protein [Chitinophagaceae bacterium]
MIHKAMILAAGLGTRLKPWTDKHPKALALVNGKSLLQRNIEYLQGFAINKVIINVHHFAEQIIDAVTENNGWGSAVSFSDETDAVLETGGGLKRASPYFNDVEHFILMNGDILTDLNIAKMYEQHCQQQSLATLAVTERKTSRYLLFNDSHMLCGWKNDNTGQVKGLNGIKKAFSGIQIIDTSMLPMITDEGKFSIIDIYLKLCGQQKLMAYDHSNGLLQDVGKPESILAAEKIFL